MKRFSLLLAIFLSILAAEPAVAWFWEKKEVKAPEVSQEIRNDAAPKAEEGVVGWFKEAGRNLRDFFKGTGKEVKKSAKQVPGELKEGAKGVGRSLKEGGKEIKQDARQVPGKIKEGARDIGHGFKELGKEIKEGTKEALKD